MQIVTLVSKILVYNNLRWSAIDLHYPANSHNCQIVQDGPAYNQLLNNNYTSRLVNYNKSVVISLLLNN